MAGGLSFQTQLASIMEVLANAAVAEICKLVEDDYAVASLQMTQCQRENKALKRKLQLLELKAARGNAERRLRDGSANNSRLRVHINASVDRIREASGGAFVQQADMVPWPGTAAAGEAAGLSINSGSIKCRSPDVGMAEPEEVLVKKEVFSQFEESEEEVPLIGDDGVLEGVHRGVGGERHAGQSLTSNTNTSNSSRGVEVSDSPPLLSCEHTTNFDVRGQLQETITPQQYINDRRSDSHSDMLCDSSKRANSLVDNYFTEPVAVEGQSCSYSTAATNSPSTSSSFNGRYNPDFVLSQPFKDHSTLQHRTSAKERLFVCNYCGKAFNRPKKVEIHQRIHTGEKPFSCPTCGKMFSEAGNLRKHQRIHTGEKPYTCGLCGRGFAWIRNLKTHQLKSHPEIHTEEDSQEHT